MLLFLLNLYGDFLFLIILFIIFSAWFLISFSLRIIFILVLLFGHLFAHVFMFVSQICNGWLGKVINKIVGKINGLAQFLGVKILFQIPFRNEDALVLKYLDYVGAWNLPLCYRESYLQVASQIDNVIVSNIFDQLVRLQLLILFFLQRLIIYIYLVL